MAGACLAWWDITMDLLDSTSKTGEGTSIWEVLGSLNNLWVSLRLCNFLRGESAAVAYSPISGEAEGFNNPKSNKSQLKLKGL